MVELNSGLMIKDLNLFPNMNNKSNNSSSNNDDSLNRKQKGGGTKLGNNSSKKETDPFTLKRITVNEDHMDLKNVDKPSTNNVVEVQSENSTDQNTGVQKIQTTENSNLDANKINTEKNSGNTVSSSNTGPVEIQSQPVVIDRSMVSSMMMNRVMDIKQNLVKSIKN